MKTELRSESYAWQKQWRIERARGLKRSTGPERAQAHVQGLVRDFGVTARSIAEAAVISRTLVNRLERGICKGLYVASERKILAVRPHDLMENISPVSWVPATGGKRRLQALHAIGWRHVDLSPRLGFDARTVAGAKALITQRKHQAICRVYDALWNQPGPSSQGRSRAARLGYAPPLAWDDDTIDDPSAAPDLGKKVKASGRPGTDDVLLSDAQLEDVEFLLEQATPWPAIADRLQVQPTTLERSLYRKGRGDLVTRAKTMPDRIAYSRAS